MVTPSSETPDLPTPRGEGAEIANRPVSAPVKATVCSFTDYYAWCRECGWSSDHVTLRRDARWMANNHKCEDQTGEKPYVRT